MLIVLYVEKPGQEYDKILDILFLCVGLLHPAGMPRFFLLSLLVLRTNCSHCLLLCFELDINHFLKIISTVVCRAGWAPGSGAGPAQSRHPHPPADHHLSHPGGVSSHLGDRAGGRWTRMFLFRDLRLSVLATTCGLVRPNSAVLKKWPT